MHGLYVNSIYRMMRIQIHHTDVTDTKKRGSREKKISEMRALWILGASLRNGKRNFNVKKWLS